tara:strand:- start:1204 stop:1857 length:654 start_codon:yes stop_codon:yes gene_type:complete
MANEGSTNTIGLSPNEMLAELKFRLEDPNEDIFSASEKLKALNDGLSRVCSIVPPTLLTELTTSTEVDMDASGSYKSSFIFESASSVEKLGAKPFRNAIMRIVQGSNDIIWHEIELTDLEKITNSFLAPSATDKLGYFHRLGTNIHLDPTPSANITVYYLKEPTVISASDTTHELNSALHYAIVDFAEYICWKTDNRMERANLAYSNAMDIINAYIS